MNGLNSPAQPVETSTPSEAADPPFRFGVDEQQAAIVIAAVPGGLRNIQEIYPLTPLQEGLLFHHLLDEHGDTYILSTLFELASRSQLDNLIFAFEKVLERHDVLRTSIHWENIPKPVQVVQRRVHLAVIELTLERNRDPITQMKERMFPPWPKWNLRQAPLIRLEIVAESSGPKWYALLQVHHIVCDHQSLRTMVSEALAHIEGRAIRLLPLSPYREYVIQVLKDAHSDAAEGFFRRVLGSVSEPTAPFELLDVHSDGIRINDAVMQLDRNLSARVYALSHRTGVSPARLFHAAWALVVAHTSRRDDVIFGTVLLSRYQRDMRRQSVVGMAVNTLPLRIQLAGLSAQELVEQTHQNLRSLLRYDYAPLTLAQRCSGMSGTTPLFTSILNYRRSAPDPVMDATATGIRVVARGEAWSNYPVAVTVDDLGEGAGFELTATTDRRISPNRVLTYLSAATDSLVRELDQASGTAALELSILPEQERHEVLELFNAPTLTSCDDSPLHYLFEGQVRRSPDAIAVVYGDRELTYSELNSRANRLARHLRAHGVSVDTPVALCVERGIEMFVTMLAVLKAGGAYVPLDPEYPGERLTYMLQDAAPKVLLTQEHLKSRIRDTGIVLIPVDSQWNQIAEHSDDNLDALAQQSCPHSLAYIIYTSGSTGRPKGAMIEHRNVIHLWLGLETVFREPVDCRHVALNASINFDASVQQFVQLLSGRTVFPIPRETRRDAGQLLRFIAENRIDAIDCTPSQLKTWLAEGLFEHKTRGLRTVLVGGEEIDPELWRALAESPETQFYNVYGPTECTVDSTIAHINGDFGASHIGGPMPNRRIYILDSRRQPTPIGVVGEMYIGGAGLARGYWKQSSLTSDRFLPDPFAASADGRMYKTGDLGRWRPDGKIEYVGRSDNQVKIRGYRIELGEIEAQLARHPQLSKATVIAREDAAKDKQLVAYYVCREPSGDEQSPDAEALRAHLRTSLPEYMIPSAFVALSHLPFTPSGKLDRRALPVPSASAFARRQYESPQGEVEQALAGIWSALLRVERIGRHDNFFELGGHSLLIVQMLDRLRRIGLSIEVRRVFEEPTLSALARTVARHSDVGIAVPPNRIPAGCGAVTPDMLPLIELQREHIERIAQLVPGGMANIQDIYPLAPLQEGILFHHLMNTGGGDTYIFPIALRISSRERLSEFVTALQAVIDRHDVLRTAVFWEHLPQPVQVVHRSARLTVEKLSLDSDRDPIEQLREQMNLEHQRLDLHVAPLIRLRVAQGRDEQWYALMQTHHVTSDHVTLEIITAEVVTHLKGLAHTLPAPLSYRTHVAQALAQARNQDAAKFFQRKLADIHEPTAPFGLLDVHGDGAHTVEGHRDLSSELATAIRAQARRLGMSAATLFHAAWALVIARTSGREDVVFGTVLLGRLQVSAGAERILGMFINTLPLRLRLSGITIKELVDHAQRELVELLAHEQSSLSVAQRCSGIPGTAPLFTALLNFRYSSPDPDAQWCSAHGITQLAFRERTNYPITLSVDDLGEDFSLTAQTDERIDPHQLLAYLDEAITSLVRTLKVAPETPALQITVVPSVERGLVLKTFNATEYEYPRDKLVHELFETQVRSTPDSVALSQGGRSLTYAQLNSKANQLARRLVNRGVVPDQVVGICISRSPEMVIGLLAILKAGGAYLPLDPNYPADRLRYMVEDAAPKLLLLQENFSEAFSQSIAELIPLGAVLEEIYRHEDGDIGTAELQATANNLVYVIYTSGSTGLPKGTAMPHRAVVNLVEWQRRVLPAQGQRVLQFAALSFDVAFQEIFSTLCAGGTLLLIDEWLRRDARKLLQFLSAQAVDRLFVPPLMLQSLAEYSGNATSIPLFMRDVITAGEQLRITPDISALFGRLSKCRLHNHYGPTETHVVTALTLTGDAAGWPDLPTIGRPIANTQIYVLDSTHQPAPRGVPGEIYIGGAGLAREYLGRPDLTAQRFVSSPFSTDPTARLYKTGDMGLWQPDGTLEYHGRNDDQVKIRGFRIELGEIETKLTHHEGVKEAAIIAREDVPGQKYLAAYITARTASPPTPDDLREHLKGLLPEHMVPSAIVVLERLPLTPSGKLDRRALPAPGIATSTSNNYEPPHEGVEKVLAQIWQEVLGTPLVGRNNNFFDLGGHSMLVLKTLVRIEDAFGTSLQVIDVYRNPTLHQLGACIEGVGSQDRRVDLGAEAVIGHLNTMGTAIIRTPAEGVLLTGATGFVGRFLLAHLLRETAATIFCLVRARSLEQAASRLRVNLQKWDLWQDHFATRIVAIPGDLTLPQLGASGVYWRMLHEEVDSIYHCGASMNHLETYAMAKPANVGGTRELLKLASHGRPKLLNYISTLGVFNSFGNTNIRRVVSEDTPIDDEMHLNSQGYVASKWVSEKLFMSAREHGIACNIFRVGLVWADSELGRYDELQREYRILKSCALSGFGIKDYRYAMTPTPVDYIARSIVSLAERHPEGRQNFHIASCSEMNWGLFESYNRHTDVRLELLPFYDWVREIKRLHHTGHSLPVVPLIQLAFSMDRNSFSQYARTLHAPADTRFDCARTYQHLGRLGIDPPLFNEALVSVCMDDLLSRDPDVRNFYNCDRSPPSADRSMRSGATGAAK